MGLLDDAIREHLELKRRHGASEEEVAQKEAEALGPARREFPMPPAPAPPLEPDHHALDPETAFEHPYADEEPAREALDEHEAGELEPTPFEDAPASEEDEPGPPHAYTVESEDVLEETPEFLQDVPEHDRLWFEQKPPRDFDFD